MPTIIESKDFLNTTVFISFLLNTSTYGVPVTSTPDDIRPSFSLAPVSLETVGPSCVSNVLLPITIEADLITTDGDISEVIVTGESTSPTTVSFERIDSTLMLRSFATIFDGISYGTETYLDSPGATEYSGLRT